jgi:threonine aldolase
MREAMARAEVGDDVYGEDPVIRLLEEKVAEITGKQAALFVPSGSMGNQVAILCHTRRGDEVVIGEGSHCAFYESGAAPAWSGVQFAVAGEGGLFTARELADAIKPDEYHYPRTSLVIVENTHNRAGGRVFPQSDVVAIAEVARSRARQAQATQPIQAARPAPTEALKEGVKEAIKLHLDGARIWNASAATGTAVAELAAPFDTVSVCFSKGLGAPVGSALCGEASLITTTARRFRKMLGGGMRQAGILAAAALYALDHHRSRLAEDHESALAIAAELRAVEGAIVSGVETNIINIDTPGVPAALTVQAAKRRGILVGSSGPHRIRAVTHLDVRKESVIPAARALAEALREAIAESVSR